eukprot:13740163-Alexandrium_andersonii.AAC.1
MGGTALSCGALCGTDLDGPLKSLLRSGAFGPQRQPTRGNEAALEAAPIGKSVQATAPGETAKGLR